MATDAIKIEVASLDSNFTKELAKAVAEAMKKSQSKAKQTSKSALDKTDTDKKPDKDTATVLKQIIGVAKGAGKAAGAIIIVAKLVIKAIETLTASVEINSKQLVNQSTLFTDKSILDLMQRTGEDATGAAATQRSLDMLGLSLEDIQSGKVTAEQMAAFEQVREQELKQLQAISAISTPMMAAWQTMALNLSVNLQQFRDSITIILAKTGKITELAEHVQAVISDALARTSSTLGPVINAILSVIVPLLDTIMIVVDLIWPLVEFIVAVVSEVGRYIGQILTMLNPILEKLKPIFDFVGKALMNILNYITGFIDFIMPVIEVLFKVVEVIVTVISAMFEVASFIEDVIAKITNWLQSLIPWSANKHAEEKAISNMSSNITYNNGGNTTNYSNTTNVSSNNLLGNPWTYANG